MKIFKSIDGRLEDLGFLKKEESTLFARYIRIEKNYTQYVDIVHKNTGNHIVQSYDPNLHDEKCIGNTCIGLTELEMKLFRKKLIRKFGRMV